MTADDEPLAIALWVERTQGAQAEVYIAGQIGALALRGDRLPAFDPGQNVA